MSDLHLGARQSQTKKILSFLEENESDILILNGDIIDGWALKPFVPFKMNNIEIVRKYVHIGLDGRKYFCFHGDVLDFVIMKVRWLAIIGGWSYDFVIRLNTIYNYIRQKFNLPYHSLANTIKQSVKGAINFVSDFESNAIGLTKQKGYDVSVCGHIHQPKLDKDYMNSGDFCENSTCLVEDFNGEWFIISVK